MTKTYLVCMTRAVNQLAVFEMVGDSRASVMQELRDRPGLAEPHWADTTDQPAPKIEFVEKTVRPGHGEQVDQ